MNASMEEAIIAYLNKFNFNSNWTSIDDLFTSETLLEMVKLLCDQHYTADDFELNTFYENSIIKGFEHIFKSLNHYYRAELQLTVNKVELDLDEYDLVHEKDEKQILTIIKLILGIVIKTQNDTYIGYMLDLSEDDAGIMQELCQDTMGMLENFPKADPEAEAASPLEDSPDVSGMSTLKEQQYLERINKLSMQIESLNNEK